MAINKTTFGRTDCEESRKSYLDYCDKHPMKTVLKKETNLKDYLYNNYPWLYRKAYLERSLVMTGEQGIDGILDYLCGAAIMCSNGENYMNAYKQIMEECVEESGRDSSFMEGIFMEKEDLFDGASSEVMWAEDMLYNPEPLLIFLVEDDFEEFSEEFPEEFSAVTDYFLPEDYSHGISSHAWFDGISPSFYKHAIYKNLPEELWPYSYWVGDSGYTIFAIPESLLDDAVASGHPDYYEVPVSSTYVAKKGYQLQDGFVICDVPYDNRLGIVDDSGCFVIDVAVAAWENRE